MSENHIVVKLADVSANPIALRPVKKDDLQYLELVEDIKQRGIMNAPTVREIDIDGVKSYQIIDGAHRFAAAQDAGLETITVHVRTRTDLEVLYDQVAANSHTVDTKPVAFTKLMQHILTLNQGMHLSELAQQIGKSTEFVRKRLELKAITNETVQELIDSGKISLNNAYGLSKLSEVDQLSFLTAAQTETASEFGPRCLARVKEVTDANRQARVPKSVVFEPVPALRKFAELKESWTNPQVVAMIAGQVSTVEDAVKETLKYVVKMDALSVQEQQRAYDAKKAADAAAKADAVSKREAAAAAKTAAAAEQGAALL